MNLVFSITLGEISSSRKDEITEDRFIFSLKITLNGQNIQNDNPQDTAHETMNTSDLQGQETK